LILITDQAAIRMDDEHFAAVLVFFVLRKMKAPVTADRSNYHGGGCGLRCAPELRMLLSSRKDILPCCVKPLRRRTPKVFARPDTTKGRPSREVDPRAGK
jgi:hypothetical protein